MSEGATMMYKNTTLHVYLCSLCLYTWDDVDLQKFGSIPRHSSPFFSLTHPPSFIFLVFTAFPCFFQTLWISAGYRWQSNRGEKKEEWHRWRTKMVCSRWWQGRLNGVTTVRRGKVKDQAQRFVMGPGTATPIAGAPSASDKIQPWLKCRVLSEQRVK